MVIVEGTTFNRVRMNWQDVREGRGLLEEEQLRAKDYLLAR